ncbi:MAG: hypothetical protein ACOYLB_09575 [Phototrophicaceae bacterium]
MAEQTLPSPIATPYPFDGAFDGDNPKFLEEIRQRVESLVYEVTGSRRVLLANIAIVDFFGGDHNAAILLNQILYWSGRATSKDGWFHKTYAEWNEEIRFSPYQVWRVVRGDSRVEKFKRTLWSVGIETAVRMAPNGRNSTYYRVNEPALFTEFSTWLKEKYGFKLDKKATAHATRHTPQPPSFFHAYETHFGKISHSIKRKLHDYQRTLGESSMKAVLDRCINRAVHWNYVVSALANELVAQPTPDIASPQAPSYPSNDYDNTEWIGWGNSKPKVAVSSRITSKEKGHWDTVCTHLKLHLGEQSYKTYIRDVVLVDLFSEDNRLEYWFVTQTRHQTEQLTVRVSRLIRRLLKDVSGQEIDVRFILHHEWHTNPPP